MKVKNMSLRRWAYLIEDNLDVLGIKTYSHVNFIVGGWIYEEDGDEISISIENTGKDLSQYMVKKLIPRIKEVFQCDELNYYDKSDCDGDIEWPYWDLTYYYNKK